MSRMLSCPRPTRWWQQVLADALDHNRAFGVRAAVADHLGRVPTRAELAAGPRAAHSPAASGPARVLHVPGADAAPQCRRPQLPDAGEAESDHEGHPTPRAGGCRTRGCWTEEPAQPRPDCSESLAFLRNAAAGARLVQTDGLDSTSAAHVATCRAAAPDELHRLQRSLDRRIKRDQERPRRALQLARSI